MGNSKATSVKKLLLCSILRKLSKGFPFKLRLDIVMNLPELFFKDANFNLCYRT